MSMMHPFSRRSFLRVGVGVAGVGLLAACAPAAPATKPAETKPAETKPAEAAKPAAAAPTTAAAAPAKPAEAAKPADAAKPAADAKPAAGAPAAKPGEGGLGSQFIGKWEGGEILDKAERPAKLGEAPMLAELVKGGKLPAVEQRLPAEPLVIKPLEGIGKYGGTWRRAFTGPGDGENGNRIISLDKIVFWDYQGVKQRPGVAKSWEVKDGGKTITFFLRKGHKWSDGQPFTADDVMFWFNDIYGNKDLVPAPTAELTINGKAGTLEKVDETTVRFTFPEPYPGFMDIIGGSTFLGSSQNQGDSYRGIVAPAHYLKQFLPKYSDQAKIEAEAKAANFDSWVSYFKFKINWRLNPDLPVLGPWKTATPINTPAWTLERNPFFYAVDTEGNQLPYLDKVQMTLGENLEVINLRAIAGEYDEQERHMDLGKLPVFIENRQKGNYAIHLDPAANGADAAWQINQSFSADPEIAKWLRNRDFRHALALGLDRDQLNETFWLGVGTPGSSAPAETSPYSPGPEYRKKWATLDVNQANQLLDKIGLDKKDAEGFRLRTDGKGRLRIELVTVGGSFVPFPKIGEMMSQQLKKIGIQLDAVEHERTLAERRRDGNEVQTVIWANDGSELLYAFPDHALPVRAGQCWMGPEIGKWYQSGGSAGMKPEDPEMLKALDLFKGAFGKEEADRIKTAQEIWKIIVEESWTVGTVGLSPAVMGVRIVKNNLGNIPQRQFNGQHGRTPCAALPVTWFFKS
ncbi:MAG: ABC transporter substrate-binding protein [Chloroflexi bacterium]|nr:ABC transporter substrate-binding protein [Chloroflexota bacterium]